MRDQNSQIRGNIIAWKYHRPHPLLFMPYRVVEVFRISVCILPSSGNKRIEAAVGPFKANAKICSLAAHERSNYFSDHNMKTKLQMTIDICLPWCFSDPSLHVLRNKGKLLIILNFNNVLTTVRLNKPIHLRDLFAFGRLLTIRSAAFQRNKHIILLGKTGVLQNFPD